MPLGFELCRRVAAAALVLLGMPMSATGDTAPSGTSSRPASLVPATEPGTEDGSPDTATGNGSPSAAGHTTSPTASPSTSRTTSPSSSAPTTSSSAPSIVPGGSGSSIPTGSAGPTGSTSPSGGIVVGTNGTEAVYLADDMPRLNLVTCTGPIQRDEGHYRDNVIVFADARTGSAVNRLCTCGHDDAAHEHYREGIDCSLCDCTGFWRPWRDVLREWIARWPR